MSDKEIKYRGNYNYVEGASLEKKRKNNGINETLFVHNWLQDIPNTENWVNDLVEIRFKNTRKGFYYNSSKIRLKPGDIVAVEASPGHDIGIVSLTGELVRHQLRKYQIDITDNQFPKVYRKAKPADIDKWKEAIALEDDTMIRSRQIAEDLNLNMKIGDVEYQGDKTKAIFYYIADERVDFRSLIKVLADKFKIRIEMKQIGARQEAGRIGGVGPCGRALCCTTWMSNFVSVATNAARYQEVSLNPQKLAGQCSKLKCCLNFELPVYLDAQENLPPKEVPLQTENGTAYYQKSDFFRQLMWYSFDREMSVNLTAVPVERVKEIQKLNKENVLVSKLIENDIAPAENRSEYLNATGQESLNRFEKPHNKKRRKNRKPRRNNRPQNESK